MAFKNKTKNRNPINQNSTIDAIHQEILNQFDKKKQNINNYHKQSEILETKIKKMKIVLNKNKNIIETMKLQKKIWTLEADLNENNKIIDDITNNIEEKEYLINTGSILNQYYKIKDSDNNSLITKNQKKQQTNINNNKNNKSIINWFEKPQLVVKEEFKNINNKNKKKSKNKYDVLTKKELHQKFMSIINKDFETDNQTQEVNYDVCSYCNIDMLLNTNTSYLICSNCGLQEPIILDIDKPSYKDPPKEMTSFCYKRINHLNEFLAQFQAKETTEIPDELYNEILFEIKKERTTNMATITADKMRLILRKIKRNEYYEHIPYIINQLNGLPPPIISSEIEEVIRNMFKEIQTPFEELRPNIIPKRKNFLSYNYIMYKFFELLELDEYLNCFQLLKSRNKLYQQDIIWKHICASLNWQYIPSL